VTDGPLISCPTCGTVLRLGEKGEPLVVEDGRPYIVAELVAELPPNAVVTLRNIDSEATPMFVDAFRRMGRKDVLVVVFGEENETLEILDTDQMAAAGWVRKPE